MATLSLTKTNARQAGADDAEIITDIFVQAYGLRDDEAKAQQFARVFRHAPHEFRVLEMDGEIVSFVQIEKDHIRIGHSLITRGNVGNVACRPCHQSQGYASELLRDVVGWMRVEGYDLARLGGYVHYYSRFGWFRFPRYYLEMSMDERLGTPTSFTSKRIEELALDVSYSRQENGWIAHTHNLQLPADAEISIRKYCPSTDAPGCAAIYHEFTRWSNRLELTDAERAGAFGVRDGGSNYVFVDNGRIVGFVFATEFEADRTEFEANFTITTLAARESHLHCLEYLIRKVLDDSSLRGFSRITARIPLDRRLDAILAQIPVSMKRVEYVGGVGSNMVQITSLYNLFSHLLPELQYRFQGSHLRSWDGRIRIQTENESIQLGFRQGGIDLIGHDASQSVQIDIDQCNLLRLILGIVSFEQLFFDPDFRLDVFSLMKDLFPLKSAMPDIVG